MARSTLLKIDDPIATPNGTIGRGWYKFFAQIERLIGGAASTTSTGLTTNADGALTIADDGVSNSTCCANPCRCRSSASP
jgi:hypothetical protein